MRWEGRRESSNIEDRRGSGGGNFGGGRGTGVFGIIIFISWCLLWRGSFRLSGHTGFSGQSSQRLETQRRTAACESF